MYIDVPTVILSLGWPGLFPKVSKQSVRQYLLQTVLGLIYFIAKPLSANGLENSETSRQICAIQEERENEK